MAGIMKNGFIDVARDMEREVYRESPVPAIAGRLPLR
jgi:hypothetical protein